MFTNRSLAVVAMLFAAAVLAHPGPAMAQGDVDQMGGQPPYQKPGQVMSPARTKAIAEIDRFYKTYKAKKLYDADIAEFAQHLIQKFPHGNINELVFLVMRDALKEMNEDKKYFLNKLKQYNTKGLASPDDTHPGPAMAQADVDKAMGVTPSLGAGKGPAIPGQNVGMEQIGDPDDERSAKGASPPNNLGGAAGKLPVPMPPGIAPAGKALQGLNRGPATEASQGLGRTHATPVPSPPDRPK